MLACVAATAMQSAPPDPAPATPPSTPAPTAPAAAPRDTPASAPPAPTAPPGAATPATPPTAPADPARPVDAGVSAQNSPIEREMDAQWDETVNRGLQWLASTQNADGSFGRGRLSGNAGIVSLCALAFMADGNIPGRGRYGAVVERALEYVLKNVSESGLVMSEGVNGPMYGHGFAALFLGEIYGMTPENTRVRDALVRAIRIIQNSQNEEGGWRYHPVPYDADVSVTICQVMALRSARNAGIEIPKDVIDGAVRYVRECQNPDGGFRYMRNTGASGWPRTAAGVASLFYAGVYDDDSIPRGLAYLRRVALPDGGGAAGQPYYFYGHYYAAQAMYLAGGDWWKDWWPRIRDELVNRQQADGSWLDPQWGQPLGTSMALIILQMPKRYLPIFQK
ncbi:MAG: terpene cyclase/mutase family protein [Phycisphaerae bacterium]|nr:terpene cyclase/mutase family protein [Phycisphaerae bacterium]